MFDFSVRRMRDQTLLLRLASFLAALVLLPSSAIAGSCIGGLDSGRSCTNNSQCRGWCTSGPKAHQFCTSNSQCQSSCGNNEQLCKEDSDCPGSYCKQHRCDIGNCSTNSAKKPAVKKSGRFTIPLEVEASPKNSLTRADVLTVDGHDEILLFSFDCSGCKVEAALQVPGGMVPRIWIDGAEHTYIGKSVPVTHESMFRPSQTEADEEGNIVAMATSGSIFEKNRLRGWSFNSDSKGPLVFKVVRGEGYVHVSGHGTVTGPDGKAHKL